MKVAYLSASVLPSRAANSVHVVKMCQALVDNGHAVTLFAPNVKIGTELGVSDIYAYYGVKPNFLIQKKAWYKYFGRFYLSGFLSALTAFRGGYDIVLARCLPSALFSALFNIPVIFEFHQPISDSGRLSSFNDFLFKRLIRSNSFIGFVSITYALEKHFLEHYPELEGRICVAPDGSDPFPMQFKAAPLPSRPDRLQVGYVGQLYAGKGMEVVSKLCELAPFADFHVVGGLQSDIDKWLTVLSGIKNITFHGFVPPSETSGFIAALDVLLLPNQHKITWHKAGGDIGQWTSPLKMFEYMSAGKPIVSSDIPVLREVLRDEHNALLCPPDDIESWVAALRRLEDRSLRKKLGAQALKDFTDLYTWRRRAQKILNIV